MTRRPTSRPLPSPSPRVALVGVHGYGMIHLRRIRRLADAGRCTLVAVASRSTLEAEAQDLVGDAARYPSLPDLLDAVTPDVVVISTPIHTHAELAAAAMSAGAHVLLEKPPTASLAEFTVLRDLSEATGRSCQIGFQSLGSTAFGEIERAVAQGEIGEVTGIGGVGTWLRTTDYYARSRWAGRRELDGHAVVDGVVTNPLAHAVATALRIDGSGRAEDIADIEVDLYRAHDIESDDTSAVRILTTKGTPIALGLTLCAARQRSPRLVVHGSEGTITYLYREDVVAVTGPTGSRRVACGRTDLLDDLLDHVSDPAVPLLAPIAQTGAFMRVLEAVRSAPDPRPIPAEFIDWRHDEAGHHPVVQDVEHWCERVATELGTFRTLGAPWASHAATSVDR